ncbi:uncharacterized protein METZ01_LOCUS228780 [marine metagenome]|uniref:Uncharacterized protein n=1 Tax=marine metagenome TaxID=408172 RepID=A0A382GL87_9ZZZZ
MTLDELDQAIVKLQLKIDVNKIALNKLRAYYWLQKNYSIKAENIEKVVFKYKESRVYLKDRESDDDHHFIPGNVHDILCGLDTTYSLSKKAKRYNDILIKRGEIYKSKDADLVDLKASLT